MNPILAVVDVYILMNLTCLAFILIKASDRVNEVFKKLKEESGTSIKYAINAIITLLILTVAYVPLLIKAMMKGD